MDTRKQYHLAYRAMQRTERIIDLEAREREFDELTLGFSAAVRRAARESFRQNKKCFATAKLHRLSPTMRGEIWRRSVLAIYGRPALPCAPKPAMTTRFGSRCEIVGVEDDNDLWVVVRLLDCPDATRTIHLADLRCDGVLNAIMTVIASIRRESVNA